MSIHTISSRDFTRDVAAAKQWAAEGPVFITDRGQAAHVLLSIEEYQRLTGKRRSLVDALAMEGGDDIVFEPARMDLRLRDAELGTEREDTGRP
ncbi:prevent-host-death protein [Variovorax sp. WS11]|uniref:type II toxin-antitoxin system Phd/YefM family antitoxin n=1 Tax=Variovorax sp. WS11 TaxID=1105204 RepID=UPI000D0CC59B|nr:type II toxin-antitoxin system Phd/YefM family antitoxin [Variovorax sp. WS11]NDZ15806.1 type II toxin-antitoxin system Phd/YefM family antitoxin [Variovorax sp. WS11]PSL79968.1 prevent-host-death protein [Variovorax sp. WS11]